MRIRTIKPEFWLSESLSRVSRDARLLFVGLFNACDDSGRTRAASRMLASLLFPYDEDAPKRISGWLDELEAEQCIRRYSVNGNCYLEIPKWLDHQKIDKPSKSKLPSFDEGSRILADSSRTFDVGTGNREQGRDQVMEQGKDQGALSGGVLEKSATLVRVEAIFNRRLGTKPDKAEQRAWKDAQASIEATNPEDFTLLEQFYKAKDSEKNPLYRRTSLATLMNHWSGEIDKAKKWASSRSKYDDAF